MDKAVNQGVNIRKKLQRGTTEYGHAFEHLIIQELAAYLDYTESEKKLSFWHTLNNAYEVDAIIGDAEMAIEIKSSDHIVSSHLKGLKAFQEEHPQCKLVMVSLEKRPRLFNGVEGSSWVAEPVEATQLTDTNVANSGTLDTMKVGRRYAGHTTKVCSHKNCVTQRLLFRPDSVN